MFFLLVLFQVMCYTELKLICWVYLSETEEEHLRKANTMADPRKYNLILDSLQKLLENKKLQTISVSEIAQTAGIGKGSIADHCQDIVITDGHTAFHAHGHDISGLPQCLY